MRGLAKQKNVIYGSTRGIVKNNEMITRIMMRFYCTIPVPDMIKYEVYIMDNVKTYTSVSSRFEKDMSKLLYIYNYYINDVYNGLTVISMTNTKQCILTIYS